MPGVIIDIGTGDGSFVYELAKTHPDKMFIGIDPNHGGVIGVSRKVLKKSNKGGLKNALFVLADVTDLPHELVGVANQVFINFPWGSLLSGIVLGDKKTWQNIKKICVKKATVNIILGYDKNLEIKEIEKLPDLNEKYFKEVLSLKIAEYGFNLKQVEVLSSKIIKNYPTTWAKKLGFAQERNLFYLRLSPI